MKYNTEFTVPTPNMTVLEGKLTDVVDKLASILQEDASGLNIWQAAEVHRAVRTAMTAIGRVRR